MDSKIVALVPAHNEQDNIAHTIASLKAQTQSLTEIVVVADNCTDDTVLIARNSGVTVFETTHNEDKKAGALNQYLNTHIHSMHPNDYVFVMDADSIIRDVWIERAIQEFNQDHLVGGVGGIFLGEQGSGLIGALQRNEFARYRREILRRNERAVVLTGTASMFRVSVLTEVIEARREQFLPGAQGKHAQQGVYDIEALTEDNELSLAVQHLGFKIKSPEECGVVTEVMKTWGALFRQRLRWQRGAIENLRAFGWNKVTKPYIVKQAAIYLTILAVQLFLTSIVIFACNGMLGLPHGIWWAVTAIFLAERIVTVRYAGWKGVSIAAALLFEFMYDLFISTVFMRAAWDSIRNKQASWA